GDTVLHPFVDLLWFDVRLLFQIAEHVVGADPPGSNGIDGDAVAGDLVRQGLHETDRRRSRSIGEDVAYQALRFLGSRGADGAEAPPARLSHRRNDLAGETDDAHRVEVETPPEVGVTPVVEIAGDIFLDIADRNVRRTEFRCHRGHCRGNPL